MSDLHDEIDLLARQIERRIARSEDVLRTTTDISPRANPLSGEKYLADVNDV